MEFDENEELALTKQHFNNLEKLYNQRLVLIELLLFVIFPTLLFALLVSYCIQMVLDEIQMELDEKDYVELTPFWKRLLPKTLHKWRLKKN